MMSLKRLVSCLLLGGLTLGMASSAAGQSLQDADFFDLVGDAQFFAPPDFTSYDREPYANQGYFLTVDWMHMILSAPNQVVVGTIPAPSASNPGGGFRQVFVGAPAGGNPALYPVTGSQVSPYFPQGAPPFGFNEFNSLTTGHFDSDMQSGQIVQIGNMRANHGWQARWFEMKEHDEEIYGSKTGLALSDPQNLLIGFYDDNGDGSDDDIQADFFSGSGRQTIFLQLVPIQPPPMMPPFLMLVGNPGTEYDDLVPQGIIFEETKLRLSNELWSVEAHYVNRFKRLHHGGYLEFFAGARYMNFDEEFNFHGLGGLLVETKVDTWAENRILGPQFALRYFKKCNRWTVGLTSMFTAGVNFQSNRQRARVMTSNGSQIFGAGTDEIFVQTNTTPYLTRVRFDRFYGQGTHHTVHSETFSPILELDFNVTYQLYRNFSLRAGAKAMYVSGLSRPTNLVNYTFPDFGILEQNNQDDLLSYGATFGIDFNR